MIPLNIFYAEIVIGFVFLPQSCTTKDAPQNHQSTKKYAGKLHKSTKLTHQKLQYNKNRVPQTS